MLRAHAPIPSLDGLRAISISMVVIAKLHYPSEVGGAFANLGVRIFFLESGYLRISDYNFAAEGQNRDESQPASRRKAWVCGPAVTDYNLR
jgi:peptidoglycan/LPS O-acetylase OafA/YrhL